jgi:hypothetical protein
MRSSRRAELLASEALGEARGCPPAEDLQSWHGGLLEASLRKKIERHLETCRACSEAVEFLSGVGDQPSTEEATERIPARSLEGSDAFIETISEGEPSASPARFLAPWWGFGLAAAAALVLGLLLPRLWQSPPVIAVAEVVPVSVTRGEEVGLRSGDAFAVRLSLDAEAAVMIILLTTDGSLALLDPSSEREPLRRVVDGGEVFIPSPGEARRWRLDERAGTERLIIAAFHGEPEPASDLLARSREAAEGAGPDPARRAAAVMTALLAGGAEVTLLPFEHLP